MDNLVWVTAVSTAVQAVATIVLVCITAAYARDTKRLTDTAKDQIQQSQVELEELKKQVEVAQEQLRLEYEPNILLNVLETNRGSNLFRLALTNLGRYPVHINHTGIKRYAGDNAENIHYTLKEGLTLLSGTTIDIGDLSVLSNANPLLYSPKLEKYKVNPLPIEVNFQYGTTADDVHYNEFHIQSESLGTNALNIRVSLVEKARVKAPRFVSLEVADEVK